MASVFVNNMDTVPTLEDRLDVIRKCSSVMFICHGPASSTPYEGWLSVRKGVSMTLTNDSNSEGKRHYPRKTFTLIYCLVPPPDEAISDFSDLEPKEKFK